MDENRKKRFLPYLLGALQVFIGLTAIIGGFGLVSDPSGTRMDIPLEWLGNSPFTNYLIPGLVLLIINGGGNFSAGIVTVLRNRYAGEIAVLMGTFLVFYMMTEIWFIGLRTFLQPLYFILGVTELMLGWKLRKLVLTLHSHPRRVVTKI
ncbi:MAG: hypothetical protein ACFFC7_34635 [Candidatus Hermodarchaeota archaeon]